MKAKFFTCRECLMGAPTANVWARLMACKCISLEVAQ